MADSQVRLLHLYDALADFKADFRDRNLVKMVSKYVVGPRVLDVGAGVGFLVSSLRRAGFEAFGIEPDNNLINLGRKHFGELAIIQGTGTDIGRKGFKDMDTIVTIDVLEHIENDSAVLVEIRRTLHPGGRLIVVVPALPWLYGKRDVNLGHYRRYSREELERKLRESGFTVEKSRYWNFAGVLPYLWYERVLRKELQTTLRYRSPHMLKRTLSRVLDMWFAVVENNINFCVGLSLLCVAQKNDTI